MTPEEKNKIVLGQLYTVPTVVERKQTNADGKIEAVEEDSEEILTLRPIKLNRWNELQAARIDDIQYEAKLIAFTARKEVDWVENSVNPSALEDLVKKCTEINKGFFDWLSRVKAAVLVKREEYERILGRQNLSNQNTSSVSETSSPRLPTDTV